MEGERLSQPHQPNQLLQSLGLAWHGAALQPAGGELAGCSLFVAGVPCAMCHPIHARAGPTRPALSFWGCLLGKIKSERLAALWTWVSAVPPFLS